jgi:uncharacterized protein YndB with AHSA1/START domain
MNPTTTPGTVFSTPSDREVAWTRSFAAPRERVFRAFTVKGQADLNAGGRET